MSSSFLLLLLLFSITSVGAVGADQTHLNEDQKDGNDDDDCIVCCHMGETPRCHLSLGNPFHDQSNAKIVH